MTVSDIIALFAYGQDYEIRGAYSGKLYHRSYVNSKKNLEKYLNREVSTAPIYSDMRMHTGTNRWCTSILVIYMYDYDLCKENNK